MQRTNWFTNPNLNGPLDNIHVYGDHRATYNQTSHQLEITGGSGAYGFDLTVPKNTDFVFACFLWTYKPSAGKICAVYTINGSNNPNEAAVLNAVNGSNNVLLRFNSGDTGRIRIEFQAGSGNMVNIEKPIVELADEYDSAVGGASGLLHGGYDAVAVGATIGRVVSDDGHEPMHEPILDHHLASRRVGADHDRSERDWDGILGQCLCERHRRHYLDTIPLWRHQCKPTCQLQSDRQQFRCDVNELFRQVRQSDRHRDEYAHLHVGRISGEQDPARRHRIFRRGHDAARLTLLGVMA
ncbi:hypothetical protein DRBB27_0691 [Bifidobacterium breve]|uniref:Uncharacterized protein n=1 Tax=Bifidobacterium breve TaxID=1685 RepID=A0AAN1IDW2_BIFBR|nr:hypothetical protein DRBB27_0691 [Bifidobacterium breve]AUE18254.1 hypothetical protein DRBB29_0692 [Bifidobacterium breve]